MQFKKVEIENKEQIGYIELKQQNSRFELNNITTFTLSVNGLNAPIKKYGLL